MTDKQQKLVLVSQIKSTKRLKLLSLDKLFETIKGATWESESWDQICGGLSNKYFRGSESDWILLDKYK